MMDNGCRGSFLKNEEIHGNLTNTYSPNQGQSVSNIPCSLNGKYKRCFARRKKEKTGSYLLPKQEHDIELKGCDYIKGQIPADFLVETTPRRRQQEGVQEIRKYKRRNEVRRHVACGNYILDGASALMVQRWSMLVSPEGKEYTYALGFKFETMNNEAEYEALLAGLRIADEMEIKNLAIYVDLQLVVNQVKGLFKAKQPAIKQYLEKMNKILKGFDTYSKEHIQRNQNNKANALTNLASMTFKHLNKDVLVEVLANRLLNSKEVSTITAETKENWMTPTYECLISVLLSEDPKEGRKAPRRLKALSKRYTKAPTDSTWSPIPWY
ncbi:reverse transcriptase domain-containing protein [Tanacetum coccineum]